MNPAKNKIFYNFPFFLFRLEHISVLLDTRVAFTDGGGFGMVNSNVQEFPALKQNPEIGRVEMVRLNMPWRNISSKFT